MIRKNRPSRMSSFKFHQSKQISNFIIKNKFYHIIYYVLQHINVYV
jgi:hypothetical protein